jgi:hypothetical protein
MAGYQLDFTAIKLIQGAVIGNQIPFFEIDMCFGFTPEPISSRKKAMQLPSVRIMRRTGGFTRINSFRFRAAVNFLRTDKKINVIVFCYLSRPV